MRIVGMIMDGAIDQTERWLIGELCFYGSYGSKDVEKSGDIKAYLSR